MWARLYISFKSCRFKGVDWDQASIGVRVRENKMAVTDNGVTGDTFDSIGTNDKVGLVSSVICKMYNLTTRRSTSQ